MLSDLTRAGATFQEELAILLDLARKGDMRAIRERAAHIETLGEQYAPFARILRELARRCAAFAGIKHRSGGIPRVGMVSLEGVNPVAPARDILLV